MGIFFKWPWEKGASWVSKYKWFFIIIGILIIIILIAFAYKTFKGK